MSCTATTMLVGLGMFWVGVYVAARLAAWYYRSER